MQKEEITEAELLNYIKKSDSIKLDEIRIEYEMSVCRAGNTFSKRRSKTR